MTLTAVFSRLKTAAVAAGRRGWSTLREKRDLPETHETGEGAFRPLPVSPSPTGRFSIDTVSGGDNLRIVSLTLP